MTLVLAVVSVVFDWLTAWFLRIVKGDD